MQPPVQLAQTVPTFFMIMIVIPALAARIQRLGVDRQNVEFIMMIIRDRPRAKPAGA